MGFLSSFNSGVASAFGSVGGLLNGITGVTESQDRTYKQQQRAMDSQNAYNMYMWNLQNQYNSPASQLARMREAGIDINPTSYALGTGNLSNTAALVGSASGFSGSGSPAGNPISSLMGMASGIQGIRESKARQDNIETQNSNIRALADVNNEIARQKANDNAFFEKYGYYPPTSATPVGSEYETGVIGDIMPIIAKYMLNNEK